MAAAQSVSVGFGGFEHDSATTCICLACCGVAGEANTPGVDARQRGLDQAFEALEAHFPLIAGTFAERFALAEGGDSAVPNVLMQQNAGTVYTSFDTDTGDVDQGIDALIYPYKWNTTNLTYSFPDTLDDYTYTPLIDFAPMTGDLQTMARSALAEFAAIAPFTFTELTGAADREADLAIALNPGFNSAYAWLPSSGSQGGDTWYGWHLTNPITPAIGSYDYHTMLHEFGHALGLKHGHESTYGGAIPFELNSMEFSVMTYLSYVGSLGGAYTNSDGDYAQSLMMLDIAAIQRMYGADFTHNAGDTTYSFDLATGRMFVDGVDVIAAAGLTKYDGSDTIFRTIWDGGGNDTYDFSNYTTSLSIDLRPGEWVDLDVNGTFQRAHLGGGNFARGHIANALLYEDDSRSLIENAKGGSGNDWFRGNDADNIFWGGDGDDVFYDSVGGDTYYGDDGLDVLEFEAAFTSYIFDISGSFIQAINGAVDWISDSVEQVLFADASWTWLDLYMWIVGGDDSSNLAPTASDDLANVNGGGSVEVAVLENDSDPDGDQISIWSFDQGANGTVVQSGNTLVYTPNVGFAGTDIFSYSVADGRGGADTAVVTVTVTMPMPSLTPFDDLVTFEHGTASDAGGALVFSGITVSNSDKMIGVKVGESGADGGFEITASGEDFDLHAALFRSERGLATISVVAWDDGAPVGSITFQADAKGSTLQEFGDAFEGVDKVVVTADRAILVDDLDVTTYWVGDPPSPPPIPQYEAVVIDFEASQSANTDGDGPELANGLSVGGFDLLDTVLTSRPKGVVSGEQAAQTVGDTMTIAKADGRTFDFENGWFTATEGRKVSIKIEAWLDGVMVGSQDFVISDRRETFIDMDDAYFDGVDAVVISASGGVIADDLAFLV